MQLKDQVVIVTGASSGIGRETALALGKEKATVVLAARRRERLEETAEQIKAAGGTALVIPTDMTDGAQVQKMVQETVQQFRRIDVLINNAGVGLYASVEETTPEQMDKIWRTNFLSTFYAICSVLPAMKKQKKGLILTVSSMAGRRGIPLNAAYCATKFAQVGLMESMRMELRGSGIVCGLIYPGATKTEFLSALENPGKRPLRYHGPVQRPAEVARGIVKAIKNPAAQMFTQRFAHSWIVLNALVPGFTDWLVSNTVKRKTTNRLE